MSQDELISINVLPVVQPIGDFYIGSMDSRDLVAISWADIRRIEKERRKRPIAAGGRYVRGFTSCWRPRRIQRIS